MLNRRTNTEENHDVVTPGTRSPMGSGFGFAFGSPEVRSLWPTRSNFFAFINMSLFITLLLLLGHTMSYDRSLCSLRVTDAQPAEQLPHSQKKVRFSGSFGSPSGFVGSPSTAVDRAWKDILPLNVMSISEESFRNKNVSKHAVKLPEAAGGGRMALFEAFHLIHCVKVLWDGTYPDYYLREDTYAQEHLEEWRAHLDHCADMLRQKLMCDADSTLITYNWLKKHKSPHPNFNVEHTCNDYGVLIKMAKHHRVDSDLIPSRNDFPEGSLVDFEEPPFDPLADE